MDAIWLGFAAVFGATTLVAFAVQDYAIERRKIYKSLRTARAAELSSADLRRRELAAPLGNRVVVPALRRLGAAVRRFTPAGVVERLAQELAYAGSPPGWDAERVLATKAVLAIALPAIVGIGSFVAGVAVPRAFIVMALAAFVGYFLPEWILRSRSGARQDHIRRALPDALDLLSITVEAGLGFDAAVARVAREMGGPLGEEFHRVVQEMQLGNARIDAIRGLGERTTVQELKEFVLSLIQADIFGISIGRVLHVQAQEMRVKRRQIAEERAQKVPVKIIFPLIMCILPATFVVLTGPAILRILDFFSQ